MKHLPVCARNIPTLFLVFLTAFFGKHLPLILAPESAQAQSTTSQVESNNLETLNTKSDLPEDLTEVGLEELLNFDIVVTSASKREQRLGDVSSAIFVISQEDIRRSGATHVAELLRMVPGITVGRTNSNQWAISSRGFTQRFANKLLVLIDGKRIFNPITNGVFWETHEIVLEDIERIEVIRGPGAALWGANATNGVINIITKNANNTEGTLLSAGGGTEEKGFVTARQGGKLSDQTSGRVYGKYSNRDNSKLQTGEAGEDDWEVATGGFRVDSQVSEQDSLNFSGHSFYQTNTDITPTASFQSPFVDNTTFSGRRDWQGFDLDTTWNKTISETSEMQSKISYLYEDEESTWFSFRQHILDIDYQHRFSPLTYHDFLYGLSYRNYRNDSEGTFAHGIDPHERISDLFTFFFHDEIELIENRLHFIVGSKFEHNYSTGFEYMPNGRLLWTPNEKTSVWAAVSRAVTSPSRVHDDSIVPLAALVDPAAGSAALLTFFGDRDVESEDLLAYELGYRTMLSPKISLDIAGFYNVYDNLFTIEPAPPFAGPITGLQDPVFIIPLVFSNAQHGTTQGVEVALDWKATDWLRLVGVYSYIDIKIEQGDSLDLNNVMLLEGGTPEHQGSLRAQLTLPQNFEFDSFLRYVGEVPFGNIDSYFELDLRLAKHITKNLEIAVIGQNLLHEAHLERSELLFAPPPTEIERGVYAKATWSF